MSILLFSLRGVPDDEANEIRNLLAENDIDFYETSAGNWGISMPALWMRSAEDLDRAQNLLNEYHQAKAISQQQKVEQLKKAGLNKHVIDVCKEKPIRFMIYLGAIVFIIYLYIRMLFEFGL